MGEEPWEREELEEFWYEPTRNLRKLLAERKRWFRALEVEQKQNKIFELEVLLKGLVRFSNLNNHPISDRNNLFARDFTGELEVVRNSLVRAVILIRTLLPEPEANILHFQNYVETCLLSDYQRSELISRAVHQRTPIESLYILCHSLTDYSELAQNLLRLKEKPYPVFYYLEQMISREIISNRYFNPFRALGFSPHYDVIQSPRIIRVVRGIAEPGVRKIFSAVILLLFKLLRYLSLIPQNTREPSRLRDSLLIFALVKSEAKILSNAFENFVPARLKEINFANTKQGKEMIELLDSFAFQLEVEMKKIFELEIKDAGSVQEPEVLETGITRSRGLLTNIFQQAIIELCRVFDPSLRGRDVFKDFLSRLEQSLKLRRDVWLFARVLAQLETILETCEKERNLEPVFDYLGTLRNFVYYYQNMSFPLVRAYDREEFQKFFDYLNGIEDKKLAQPEFRKKFKREIHSFLMFLEATFTAVNQRAELQNLPFGTEEAEKLLRQVLA